MDDIEYIYKVTLGLNDNPWVIVAKDESDIYPIVMKEFEKRGSKAFNLQLWRVEPNQHFKFDVKRADGKIDINWCFGIEKLGEYKPYTLFK